MLLQVDHTVIMYLVDPEGQFVDYYGQNRNADEIVAGVHIQMGRYELAKASGWI